MSRKRRAVTDAMTDVDSDSSDSDVVERQSGGSSEIEDESSSAASSTSHQSDSSDLMDSDDTRDAGVHAVSDEDDSGEDEEDDVNEDTEAESCDDLFTDDSSDDEDGVSVQEKVYLEKRASLVKQLEMLEEGTLPEFARVARELEKSYTFEVERAEEEYKRTLILYKAEYTQELKITSDDLEEKKAESMEQLLNDLEDKKRMLELEKNAMDLNSDSLDLKPMSTRKLRRRPNDPAPQCKKGGPRGPAQVKVALDEDLANSDLAEIAPDVNFASGSSGRRAGKDDSYRPSAPAFPDSNDIRIEDGKLFYEKRWYMRGQSVTVVGRDFGRVSGLISGISAESISIRRVTPGPRFQVSLTHLQCGRVVLRRRN